MGKKKKAKRTNKKHDDAPYKPEPRVKQEEIDDDNLVLALASTPGASTSSAPQEAAVHIVTTARAQRATRREEIRSKAPNPTVRIKIAKSKLSKPSAARTIKIALAKVFWSFILDTTMFIWCRACEIPAAIGEGEEYVEGEGDVARRVEVHDVHAGSERHERMYREWIARGGDKVLREKEGQMRCVQGQKTMGKEGSWLRTWKFVPASEPIVKQEEVNEILPIAGPSGPPIPAVNCVGIGAPVPSRIEPSKGISRANEYESKEDLRDGRNEHGSTSLLSLIYGPRFYKTNLRF